MKMDLQTKNLTSIFRGLYVRVATQLGVDPSYVSRVARGERKSEAVEAILEKETRKIIDQIGRKLKLNSKDRKRGSGNHNGASRPKVIRRGDRSLRSSRN